MLAPAWEAYLTSNAERLIDAGFEALLIDEGALAGEGYDFRPALMEDFKDYLAATRTQSDLRGVFQLVGSDRSQ